VDWVKLATRYYADPKVASLDDTAEVLFVRGVAYAGDQETGGFIPDAVLPQLSRGRRYAATVRALVEAGLWKPESGGHRMPAWSTWQSQLDVLAARRARDRARQRRRRAKENASVDNPVSRDTGDGGVTADVTPVSHPKSGHENAVTSDVHATSRDTVAVEGELEEELPKGGMTVEPTSPNGSRPPRRCATHQTWPADATIPPCGPCADARRNYDTWHTQQTPRSPLDEQQAAARARRQRNCDTCNGAGVWMPPNSDVAHPCPDCT
jgi:hypothetical protein